MVIRYFLWGVMDIYEQLINGKESIAFRVSNQCADFSEYGHITLDVVYVKSDEGRYNDSIGFYDNYFDQKHQYKGLKISCQMDKRSELPYAWRLYIENYIGWSDVTLERAEEMVQTLRPIHRKMKKISDTEGCVESFEEFVLRLVRVLNVKAFYAKYGSDIQYKRNDNIGALRDHLRSLISENQNKLGFTKVA